MIKVLFLFCLSLFGVVSAQAAEASIKEASLEFNFRPIVTLRALYVGATPEVRVQRALARINRLTPVQMDQPIERTPFVIEGTPGVGLHIGDVVLFNVLQGDLDPEEKLSLDEAANRAAQTMAEALRSEGEQRRPELILKGVLYSVLVTAVALALLWLLRRTTRVMVERLQRVIERSEASARLRWALHGWSLVQRFAQLLMGFLALSVAYLWLTFVLARFPLTEPLGEQLGSFLFSLLHGLGMGFVNSLPGMTTALVILFLAKALNDALASFFNAVRDGRAQVAGLHKETIAATQRIVSIVVWGFGIAVAYPFIPLSHSDAFRGLSVMFGFSSRWGRRASSIS